MLERPEGEFLRFQLEAVQFWCDAGTVIRAAQEWSGTFVEWPSTCPRMRRICNL
ncbi:MAG TPA: hypothetical protein VGM60_00260 [Pseudonocardia sp.]|uniref:hypothetical protein n=1 Tax=Pseudonocardia sp. TaxID=60912 RepID=UPI002F3F85D4